MMKRTSFGLVKVDQLTDFTMEPSKDKGPKALQLRLFEDGKDLDPMDHDFYYRFKCDGEACPTHKMKIIDWELGQLYRRSRSRGRTGEELKEYIAGRFVDVMFSSDRETYLYVGTHRWHPNSFMVCGVLYFKKDE